MAVVIARVPSHVDCIRAATSFAPFAGVAAHAAQGDVLAGHDPGIVDDVLPTGPGASRTGRRECKAAVDLYAATLNRSCDRDGRGFSTCPPLRESQAAAVASLDRVFACRSGGINFRLLLADLQAAAINETAGRVYGERVPNPAAGPERANRIFGGLHANTSPKPLEFMSFTHTLTAQGAGPSAPLTGIETGGPTCRQSQTPAPTERMQDRPRWSVLHDVNHR